MFNQKSLSIIDQALLGARGFIISIAIVKLFDIELFGIYVLLTTLNTLIVRLHSGLVTLPLSAEKNIYGGGFYRYVSRHVLTCIFTIFVAMALPVLTLPLHINMLDVIFYVLGSISIINNELHRRICLISGQYSLSIILNVFMCVACVAAICFFVSEEYNSIGVIYAAYALGGLPSWIFVANKIIKTSPRNIFKHEISRVDFDICGSLFFQWLSAQSVYYFTFGFIGVGAVAILGAYRTLFSPFIILVSALDGYLPKKLGAMKDLHNDFLSAVKKEISFLCIITIISGAAIFPFYKTIISVAFSDDFLNAYTLPYLLIYFIGMSAGSISRILIIAIRCLGVNAFLSYGVIASSVFVLATIVIMSQFMPDIAPPVAITVGEVLLLMYVGARFVTRDSLRV